jgi:hypothetical protein
VCRCWQGSSATSGSRRQRGAWQLVTCR